MILICSLFGPKRMSKEHPGPRRRILNRILVLYLFSLIGVIRILGQGDDRAVTILVLFPHRTVERVILRRESLHCDAVAAMRAVVRIMYMIQKTGPMGNRTGPNHCILKKNACDAKKNNIAQISPICRAFDKGENITLAKKTRIRGISIINHVDGLKAGIFLFTNS